MNQRSEAVANGVAALCKSAVLVVGVPVAVDRLWKLTPGQSAPFARATWTGGAWGAHAALAGVAVIWLVAASSLGRDLVQALRGRVATSPNSWSARWASRIAGLVLLASAGAAMGGGVAGASPRPAVVAGSGVAPTALGTGVGAPAGEQSAAHRPAYVVRPGDSLSSIAEQELGDGGDWPVLARLNMGRLQPDGRRMTDPSLIYPGWTIQLPVPATAGPAAATTNTRPNVHAARTVTVPTHSTRAGSAIAPPIAVVGHIAPKSVGPVPPVDATPRALGRTSSAPRAPLITPVGTAAARGLAELAILGVCILAAAGIARRLRLLRRVAECLRLPGERFAPLTGEVGRAAAALDPLAEAELLDWIEGTNRLLWRACRDLAPNSPLPEVHVVRVGPDGVALYLAAPLADAAPGFVAIDEGRAWILDPALDLAELLAATRDCGRYVPALVPVGDTEDATYLVALGPGRRLVLESATGEPVDGDLAAIVLALRTLPWMEEVDVELLGVEPPAVQERCHRLHKSSTAELAELDRSSTPDPRRRLEGPWRSELLVLCGDAAITDHEAPMFDTLGRSAGMLTVGGSGTSRLVVGSDSMVLEPEGVALARTMPSCTQLDLAAAMLAGAAADPATPVSASKGPDVRAPSVNEGTRSAAPASPRAAEVLTSDDGERGEGASDPHRVHLHPGPVEVRILARAPAVVGWAVTPSTKDHARIVELVGYLALHGYAGSTERIRDAVFSRGDRVASLGRIHNVCSAARSALGTSPDGSSYLPTAAGGRYRLERSVSCDWTRFEAMRERATSAEPDVAVELLVDALSLVDGSPFADTSGWDWVLAEGLLPTIIASVVDGAHHLATLAIARQDSRLARWAVGRGRCVEPWSEVLARDVMVIADLEGDPDGVRRAWRDLELALGALDGNEPSSATRALYEELAGLPGGCAGRGAKRPDLSAT